MRGVNLICPDCGARLGKRLRGPSGAFKGRTRKQEKAERDRRERVASRDVWDACLVRAGQSALRPGEVGVICCELCGAPKAVEPHHLEGGSGRRRQQESIQNVILICRSCHDAYHRRPSAYVLSVREWCARHGYPLPNRREYREGERARIEGKGRTT